MYVTYDLEQATHGGGHALYPKVKRVYIAGEVQDWKVGSVLKRTAREVYGITVNYQQNRSGHQRKGYTARRGATVYQVAPTTTRGSSQKFHKVVELPRRAQNIHFYTDRKELPEKYRKALQHVR